MWLHHGEHIKIQNNQKNHTNIIFLKKTEKVIMTMMANTVCQALFYAIY